MNPPLPFAPEGGRTGQERTPVRLARWFVRSLLLAALVHLGLGAVEEANRRPIVQRRPVGMDRPASLWRFGQGPPERLRAFLELARPHLPPGDPVVFHIEPQPAGDEMFRFLWASYWLADRNLIPASAPASTRTELWLSFGAPIDDPRYELLWQDPGGALYRFREAEVVVSAVATHSQEAANDVPLSKSPR